MSPSKPNPTPSPQGDGLSKLEEDLGGEVTWVRIGDGETVKVQVIDYVGQRTTRFGNTRYVFLVKYNNTTANLGASKTLAKLILNAIKQHHTDMLLISRTGTGLRTQYTVKPIGEQE